MRFQFKALNIFVLPMFLVGCAADYEVALGSSVAKQRSEQVLNPNATQENMGYIPTGSGERMQTSLDVYHRQTGLEDDASMSAQNVINIPLSSGSQ